MEQVKLPANGLLVLFKVIMKRLVLVFVSLVLMSSPLHADDLQDGIDAGLQGDYKTALEKFKPLADKGNAKAQRHIGLMYFRGEGVSRNYKEALKWYRKSAKQGNANAQVSLGTMYLQGYGVRKDYKEAIKWIKLSAKQGSPMAQTKLGAIYAAGQGVPKNFKLSIKWFARAADQGVALAQVGLGRAYLEGNGVTKDVKEAYKWFYIAKSNGEEKVEGLAKRILELLKTQMTSSQTEEAKLLALAWMGSHQRALNQETFNKYKSTVGVLTDEFIDLTEGEKEAYVRGVMDGEYMLAGQIKNRELRSMVTCLNENLGTMISSSLKYTKNSLKKGELMPWPLSTLLGQICERNVEGETPEYRSGTKFSDLTEIERKVDGEEDKKKISRAYVRGVLDGNTFYLHGHFYPRINEYLKCLSKPKTLDYIVRYFNLAPLMGGLENIQASFVIAAQREKCSALFKSENHQR